VITYVDAQDESPEGAAYVDSLATIAGTYPRIDAIVTGTIDLVSHFVIWEYATALCGYLMKVCPFDQPDVASSKAVVLDILASDLPAFPLSETVDGLPLQAKVSAAVGEFDGIAAALKALFASYGEGDYVSINAFLPPFGGRFEALDGIRNDIAAALGSVTCLEIGPRYLHSIGQLQKVGPNNGVFLLLSCEDEPDIPVEGMKAPSLATLAKAQTAGDYVILSERGRRVIELRLPGHDLETIAKLRQVVKVALA
jgi:glucose-6-phosphate isomerase